MFTSKSQLLRVNEGFSNETFTILFGNRDNADSNKTRGRLCKDFRDFLLFNVPDFWFVGPFFSRRERTPRRMVSNPSVEESTITNLLHRVNNSKVSTNKRQDINGDKNNDGRT